ncbi:MAG: hypothetical protein ACJZ8R_00705 [Pseudohongiellaceae bacterium]
MRDVINDGLLVLEAITITSGLIVVALIIPAAIVYSVRSVPNPPLPKYFLFF